MSITEPEDAAVDVGGWLRNLGLEQYEATFRENGVSAEVLRHLTADDLKDLGITSVGHRRQLLQAIATLRPEASPAGDPVSFHLPASAIDSLIPAETTAERRPLSVMLCDLIGSTALSSRLDPEDLREIIRAYQTCVAATIQQFHGYIARYVGDGVLRWTPMAGQFGGLAKLGSSCCQAANFSVAVAQYASSGVRPANVECGRRAL